MGLHNEPNGREAWVLIQPSRVEVRIEVAMDDLAVRADVLHPQPHHTMCHDNTNRVTKPMGHRGCSLRSGQEWH